MYSREALTDIFQKILQFEEDVKVLYDGCIEKLADEDIINVLSSISKEEKGHIELAKQLIELIKE
jgi:rubrerythrin